MRYIFGSKGIYCPRDVIKYVDTLLTDSTAKLGNYWIGTSCNSITRRFIDHPQINVNDKFEILLVGGVIRKPIREDLTYDITYSTKEITCGVSCI